MRSGCAGAAVAAGVAMCGWMGVDRAEAASVAYKASLQFSVLAFTSDPGYPDYNFQYSISKSFDVGPDPLSFNVLSDGYQLSRQGEFIDFFDHSIAHLTGLLDENISDGQTSGYLLGGNGPNVIAYGDLQGSTIVPGPFSFTIGVVPLPAAAPMFGAALLVFSGLSYARRQVNFKQQA